tara:strand:- start:401 stop:631 length:231 start_codon:yes stop_codon:yes gene_type:complete
LINKKYKHLIEDYNDAYIAFSSDDGKLHMTVIGDPENVNTITANQCIDVFTRWLDHIGVEEAEDDNLLHMKTKGTA